MPDMFLAVKCRQLFCLDVSLKARVLCVCGHYVYGFLPFGLYFVRFGPEELVSSSAFVYKLSFLDLVECYLLLNWLLLFPNFLYCFVFR